MTTKEKASVGQSEATKHQVQSATLIVAICDSLTRAKSFFNAALTTLDNYAWPVLLVSSGVQVGLLLALALRWHA